MNRKSLFVLLSTAALLAACGGGKNPSSSSSSPASAASSTLAPTEEKILLQADDALSQVAFYDSFDAATSTLGKAITAWGDADEIFMTATVKDGYKIKPFDAVSSIKGTISSNGGAFAETSDGVKVYRLSAADGASLDKTDTIIVNVRQIRAVTGESIENATLTVSTESPIEDDQVDFTLTPADGYAVSSVSAAGKNSGTAVEVTRGEGDFKDHYSFLMIDEDVVIRAVVSAVQGVSLTASQPVSYIYDFSLTGEASGTVLNSNGASASFASGENVSVLAYVNAFDKGIKAKLGDAGVELNWDASQGCYTGSFLAPSEASTFSFAEGDAQEARTITVNFNEVTGVTVSYREDVEDSDTETEEAPTLYDHQGIYLGLSGTLPEGKAFLVEMKYEGDDGYSELTAEEDHARFYYIAMEGNVIVRVSYQDA